MLYRIFCITALASALLLSVTSIYIARVYYSHWKEALVLPVHVDEFSDKDRIYRTTSSYPLLILFGDSRVAQWRPKPEISGYHVINHGIAGETTEQMKYRFQKDVLDLKPKVVFIQAGINDLVAAVSLVDKEKIILDNLKNNIKYFVQQANDTGVRVILSTIIRPASPPWYRRMVWSNRISSMVVETNKFIRYFAGYDNTEVLDVDMILTPTQDPLSSRFAADTLHFKQTVYEVINTELLKVLK